MPTYPKRINKGFLYYNTFYSYIVGIKISGTIGKIKTAQGVKFNQAITYRVRNGMQEKYKYTIPPYTNTPKQLLDRHALRCGVFAWQMLDPGQKQYWKSIKNEYKTRTGYHYFLSEYIKDFLA
jgi:hypothetical protein